MSGAASRARRRREQQRADDRLADHVRREHGYDLRCSHCGRVRLVGELHEWEEEVNAAGPDHPFLGALRSLRPYLGQHDLVAFCRHCGCFAGVNDPDH